MEWIHHFQLFLFDFDGLLVNTESLHYRAYVNALTSCGHSCPLSFADFLSLAHRGGPAWREAVCTQIPSLADFDLLYQEKKKAYLELLETAAVELMPGAETLLSALDKASIKRCIVTNSLKSHIEPIIAQSPILQTVPHLITREDYTRPKPDPECYLKAIELYAKPSDKIIGFEDSFRGLTALRQTPALPVLVCSSSHPLFSTALSGRGVHFESLEQVSIEIEETL
jgi:beta-phosphoglucomutase